MKHTKGDKTSGKYKRSLSCSTFTHTNDKIRLCDADAKGRQRRWTCLPSSGKYLLWSRRQPPVPERENQTEEETPTSWKGKGGWGRGCERSPSLMTSHQKWSQTKCDILYDNVMVPLKPWRTLLCDCHASGWCGCVTPDLNSFNATRREREKHIQSPRHTSSILRYWRDVLKICNVFQLSLWALPLLLFCVQILVWKLETRNEKFLCILSCFRFWMSGERSLFNRPLKSTHFICRLAS